MKRSYYGQPGSTGHRPKATPKPEKTLLERLLFQVKAEVHSSYDDAWWRAAVATYGQLQKHRRSLRNAS